LSKQLQYIRLLFCALAICHPLHSQHIPLDLLKDKALSSEEKKDKFLSSAQKISEQQAPNLIRVCDSIINHPSIEVKPYIEHIKLLKAICFRKLKRFGEAIELLKAMDAGKDIAFENVINEYIARTYLVTSAYNPAVGYLFKALNYWTVVNPNPEKQVNTLTNITTCYYRSKLFDKAYDYTKKCIEVAERSKDSKLLYLSYSNLGIYFLEKGDIKNADSIYTELLPYIPGLRPLGKISFYNNYSETKRFLKDYVQSKKYIDSCYRLASLEKDTFWLSIALVNKGNLNIADNNNTAAIKECSVALKYAERFKSLVWQKNSCACLYEAYEKLNDYKNALIYYKKTKNISDSIHNEKNRNEATQKDFQYKYAVKAAADSVKQAESDKVKDAQIRAQQSQLNQEKIVRVGLFALAALILIFAGFIYSRFKASEKQKKIIESQKIITESQKDLLEEKQKEIIDSINYAKRIQYTLLANTEFLNAHLPNHFIVFKSKDIVRGDFYWAAKKEDRFYLAVCDSTGHGVPGAFMSLLNTNFLNEAIIDKNISEPNEVFNYVRKRLIENISQDGRQDGMDGILICVNDKSKKMTYAAANNSPFVIKNNVLNILDADKMPIGKGEKTEPFNLYTFEMSKGDQLYLSTDGFADQFGGPKGKKYKYKPMYDLMLKNSYLPVLQQEELLFAEFDNWKGSLEQVDDVCILGIRL